MCGGGGDGCGERELARDDGADGGANCARDGGGVRREQGEGGANARSELSGADVQARAVPEDGNCARWA